MELTSAEKTQLARRLRPAYSLTFLTHRLGLPASAYHYQRRLADEGRDPDVDIRDEVVALFERSSYTWGYRRTHASLKPQESGKRPSEKRVRRVMTKEGLEVLYDRKRRRNYDSYDHEADADKVLNVLLRDDGKHDFSTPAPNVLWVSDAVEFALPDDPRKVYLSPVLDCFDGSVVDWRAGLYASAADLTAPSLKDACQKLRSGDAPTVHTDRGAQYYAASWKIVCSSYGLSRSISRKGKSPDNARMEGFFGTLKNERFYWRDWSGWIAKDFIAQVDRWMVEYNKSRRKLSLGWRTPMEYRRAALEGAT